ncbi:hypothetical protein [Neisseria bergeri]|uniref:endonuclease toxin domain-containing protein n=1 Tax=Neisseria bergeri TaxID=1906581 RepID=UPI0027E1F2C3|nr:hypothetical protein [Neisseria bergeri]
MPSERFSDGIFCCRKHTVGNIREQNQKQPHHSQTTKEQWQQINKAIEYGKTHNVNVKVTEIK